MRTIRIFSVITLLALSTACSQQPDSGNEGVVHIRPLDITAASFKLENETIVVESNSWLEFNLRVKEAGRYKVSVNTEGDPAAEMWLEDYVGNPDGRTYNVTGIMNSANGYTTDGAPLDSGIHRMRLHINANNATFHEIEIAKIQDAFGTSEVLEQTMTGDQWVMVWSDEFEDDTPDRSKWNYNVGNWGWGNSELQYYTDEDTTNAFIRDGQLVIRAVRNPNDSTWSSARLTTQGNYAFKYGRIEISAKVAPGRGTWAAGWMLGDEYRDEISWPYCGEIDILEAVGYEINDTTGSGINHASCHTPAYYFKKDNHITSTIAVDDMVNEFHTYGIEWYPDSVRAFLDDEFYYLYDKTANELEWPFNKPQALILNLAIGGGWGGSKGIDKSWDVHEYKIDHIRVYELQ